MNKFLRSLSLFVFGLLASISASAQISLTQTTLAAAINSSTTRITVASATGVVANSTLMLIDNEALFVSSVQGVNIGVIRGSSGTKAFAHIAGSGVLLGPPPAFIAYEPSGACTAGTGIFLYTPVVNLITGNEWLCSSVTGKIVPGFGNVGDPFQVTAAVASATLITPSGPLFHVTGTTTITGITIPVGFDPKTGPGFCIIPDGIFATTAANNIALITTATVVSKPLCYTYDANTTKFYPSY